MDNLVCPSCEFDYELPRRYLHHRDDMEYAHVPRLLKCLHTCCHSCLEAQVSIGTPNRFAFPFPCTPSSDPDDTHRNPWHPFIPLRMTIMNVSCTGTAVGDSFRRRGSSCPIKHFPRRLAPQAPSTARGEPVKGSRRSEGTFATAQKEAWWCRRTVQGFRI